MIIVVLLIIIFVVKTYKSQNNTSNHQVIETQEVGKVSLYDKEIINFTIKSILNFSCQAWKKQDPSYCYMIPRLSELNTHDKEECFKFFYHTLAMIKNNVTYCNISPSPDDCIQKVNHVAGIEGKSRDEIIEKIHSETDKDVWPEASGIILRDPSYCDNPSLCQNKSSAYCYQSIQICKIFSTDSSIIDCSEFR